MAGDKQTYIFRFNIDKCMSLDLTIVDIHVLQWIYTFKISNCMKTYKENDLIYYWVSYSALMRDLRFLQIDSNKTFQRSINRLCGIFPDEKEKRDNYPLSKMIKPLYGDGSEMYITFNKTAMNYLTDGDFDTKDKNEIRLDKAESTFNYGVNRAKTRVKLSNEEIKKKKPISVEAYKVIKGMLSVPDNPFRHRINSETEGQSKLIENIATYIQEIYSGTFLMNHAFDKQWLETRPGVPDLMNHYKGKWDVIERVFPKVIEHLRTLQQENRPFPVRDLPSLFYNPKSQKSYFFTVISGFAYTDADFSMQNIKKGMDEHTINELEYNRPTDWDERAYWLNMREVYRYVYRNWMALKWHNEEDWKFSNITKFMLEYIYYLKHSSITSSRVIGLSGFGWTNFVKYLNRQKNIDILGKEECEKINEKIQK